MGRAIIIPSIQPLAIILGAAADPVVLLLRFVITMKAAVNVETMMPAIPNPAARTMMTQNSSTVRGLRMSAAELVSASRLAKGTDTALLITFRLFS